ncbi:38096_t:CDS:2, partial [Gigaspora margarita]
KIRVDPYKIDPFCGNDEDDPIEWLEAFKRATIANNWFEKRLMKIASEFFAALEKCYQWQIELNNLQQQRDEKEAIISTCRVRLVNIIVSKYKRRALNKKCPKEYQGKSKWKKDNGQEKHLPKKEDEEKGKASHYVELYMGGSKKIAQDRPNLEPRRKQEPSIIDKLFSYNVAEDIMNALENIIVGQLLQYANQRNNLAKALRRLYSQPKKQA